MASGPRFCNTASLPLTEGFRQHKHAEADSARRRRRRDLEEGTRCSPCRELCPRYAECDAFSLTSLESAGSEIAEKAQHGAADQRRRWTKPLDVYHELTDTRRSAAIRADLSIARQQPGLPCARCYERKRRAGGRLEVEEASAPTHRRCRAPRWIKDSLAAHGEAVLGACCAGCEEHETALGLRQRGPGKSVNERRQGTQSQGTKTSPLQEPPSVNHLHSPPSNEKSREQIQEIRKPDLTEPSTSCGMRRKSHVTTRPVNVKMRAMRVKEEFGSCVLTMTHSVNDPESE